MLRLILVVLIAGACSFAPPARGQEGAPSKEQQALPPKELVQYILDAKKAGENDFQIERNAVDSGWPQVVVHQAISYVQSQSKDHPEAAAKPTGAERTEPSKLEPRPADPAKADAAGATPGEKGKADAPPSAVRNPNPDRGVPDDYEIGAGDALDINVWKEPDASVHGAVVRTDGKISMPLLKDVSVVGLTPIQLEKKITEGLASLINSPDVTVIVTGTGSKKIYISGKVKREGPIQYNYRMTVMQALSEAGGITDYAKKNRIYVLRNENGKQFRLPFDYSAVLKGEHMETNYQLIPGDLIVVP